MVDMDLPPAWRKPDGTANPGGDPTGRARQAEIGGETGLLLPTRQAGAGAGIGLLVLGALLVVGAVFLVLSENTLVAVGGWVLGLLGALFVAAGVFALRGGTRAVGVLLTPEHVVLNWSPPPVKVPWSQVREVRPVAIRFGRANTRPTANYLGVATVTEGVAGGRHRSLAARFSRDLSAAVPMRLMLVDQLVVLRAFHHYLAHPDDRAELATPAAVERVHG
ncbi:hypothetical protein [Actinokineospora bangkokensis]|uniref:Uncharacterized protein n=1 Tax=Actinokineospora bangkokensis TaxID=1193682 RepID=A0A1Q9LHK5_9PSEU|nr:hypothetical protein [Actinokineospora bangkokensis]OLR91494.1 hypothetical protein BJP25_26400 [Actinokineospora bangkokensis]